MTSAATLDVSDVVQSANRRALAELRDALARMPFEEFEALCGELLESLGYSHVKVTKRGADGGIDLTAELSAGVGHIPLIVQAKRQRQNVSVAVVRELRGCLNAGERGVVMTTADFTKVAREEARETGKVDVWLVDGEQMAEKLAEQGILVRKRHLTLFEIDTEAAEKPLARSEHTVHDVARLNPVDHRPIFRTPSNRPVALELGVHFQGRKAALRPVFSALAAAAMSSAADVDYFARTSYIVFTVGAADRREPAILVKVLADRLQVLLRLGSDVPNDGSLRPYQDKAWRLFRQKVLLTSPSDVDDNLRFWLGKALRSRRT